MAAPLPAPADGGGEFRLDVEAAEEAIRTLEDARRRIKDARDDAVRLAQTSPTARDVVSLEAFTLLAQKADGGPGSFTAAMDAGRAHIERLIAQMREDIIRQQELDRSANGLDDRA